MTKAVQRAEQQKLDIAIAPMLEKDLEEVDHVMRLAFGTFLGLPDPLSFMDDADYVTTRWRCDPKAAFIAKLKNEVVGSVFASNWGSIGFLGPLTVHPSLWDKGVAKALMQPVMNCFEEWGTRQAGLFTFATSQKHIGLYQKFGFWPQHLTAIMSKNVAETSAVSQATYFSELSDDEKQMLLRDCKHLTDSVYEGLDLSREIRSVDKQQLGDTLLVWDNTKLVGLAICHCGKGTEAGTGICYIKFAVVASSPLPGYHFNDLLNACEIFAVGKGLNRIIAGMNTARGDAYMQIQRHGYRTDRLGVVMQNPNRPGYNRSGIYIIDDWR